MAIEIISQQKNPHAEKLLFVLSVSTGVQLVNPTLVFESHCSYSTDAAVAITEAPRLGGGWNGSHTFEFVLELKGWLWKT